MMLQQTQVKTALPYFRRWMREMPSIEALSKASEEKILRLWQGLGYYTRARQIKKAARLIMDRHDGRIPDTFEEIRRLPGIGPYTAGAILSIAFGRRVTAIDGNILRVFPRLFALREPIDFRRARQRILALQEKILPHKNPGGFIEALMELGALICLPKKPLCGQCPVHSFCRAFAGNLTDRLPVRKRKITIRKVRACALVIEKDGHFLLRKRPVGQLMGGFWEFPEWKTPGESPKRESESALLARRAGAQEKNIEFLFSFRRHYTRFAETLDVYRLTSAATRTSIRDMRNGNEPAWKTRWVSPAKLAELPLTSAHSRIRARLAWGAHHPEARFSASRRTRLK